MIQSNIPLGHVGFVVGEDKVGNLMILGGNQSDSVSITPISKSRLLCCVWFGTQALPSETRYKLNEISHSLSLLLMCLHSMTT